MENKPIVIGGKKIGNKFPPFIVAEAGINHNGELEKAFKMIEVAKDAGVDAIKFQTFKAEEFVSNKKQTFTYLSQGKEITESMLEMFQRYEFNEDDWFKIKKKCDEENITFLSTPQNRSDLNLLLKLGIDAIKIGSDDFTNIPLLKSYAKTKLPLILSTGMADMADVFNALNAIGGLDGYPIILLLCTSEYPTPLENVNLLKLRTLAAAFPMVTLGFSDHTQGPLASALAVSFGASFFEKHFTLNNQLPGPDHWFSENPSKLKKWVLNIRESYKMLGSGVIKPSKVENNNRKEFRRYIVALKNINKGEIFTVDNIGMRRLTEGNGFLPMFFEYFLGEKSTRNFDKGEPIGI